ncbi:hypothetical protein G7Y79_00020g048260 [Physcia stellaris]|nr:hypothetical protein G7Y79_00020g048260 [Physcia stellaris]
MAFRHGTAIDPHYKSSLPKRTGSVTAKVAKAACQLYSKSPNFGGLHGIGDSTVTSGGKLLLGRMVFLTDISISEAQPGGDIQYEWFKLNIFARWDASSKEHTMVVLDPKPKIGGMIVKHFFHFKNSTHSENPCSVYIPVAELAVELQEDAVWKIRNEVRRVEKSRQSICPQPSNSQIHFCRLHDLARHAIHVSETLDLTNQTLHRMIEHHARFSVRSATPAAATEDDNEETRSTIPETAHQNHSAHDQLRCYQDAIQNLRLRSIANKDRLQNEIQYSFNLVAQDIARTSNVIQNAVQVDSSVRRRLRLLQQPSFR